MAMKSFTTGTPAMVEAMVANLPEKYEMTLNIEDMEALIVVLGSVYGYYLPSDTTEEIRGRARDLFTDLACTLDIEGI